jgi:HEPN domain-containing protein
MVWGRRDQKLARSTQHLYNDGMERSADWLSQARSDLAHARNDLTDGFFDWACFSAQQAAEKAVKALLMARGAEPWGHASADLLRSARTIVAVPDDLIDAALELDKAYISARYPDAHPSGSPHDRYTRGEAQRMVDNATSIVGFSQSHLPNA